MIKKTWKEILSEHTRYFTNGRYDILTTNQVVTDIADIKTEYHQMNNKYYRSYGTYRHNIAIDTSLIKINETKIPEKDILKCFYNFKNGKNDNDNNTNLIEFTDYTFGGVVLAQSYAVNSNEISLEDLFAEYGYDYIKAQDLSALNNGLTTYYFEAPSENENEEQNTNIGWTYQILPYGMIYKDEEDIDESTGLPKEKLVEYDGKYCPTVQEIIDGSLYIVIQSGTKSPKRIYFNNNYLPSMFINDDKHPNNLEAYILENQQTLKLCDIKLYERIGVEVKWEKLIGIQNLYKIIRQLQDSGISIGNIKFKTYFYVTYKVSNQNIKYLITSIFNVLKPADGIINHDMLNQDLILKNQDVDIQQVEEDGYFNFLTAMSALTNTTGKVYVGKISDDTPPYLNITFAFGMSVLLEGYSLTYADLSESYKLSWYEYNENTLSYNIQANIKDYIHGNGIIYLNNNNILKEGNNFILLNNKTSGSTLTLNVKFTDLSENNNLKFNLSAIDTNNTKYILTTSFNDPGISKHYITNNNSENIIEITIEDNYLNLLVLSNSKTEEFESKSIGIKFINTDNNISYNANLKIIYEKENS